MLSCVTVPMWPLLALVPLAMAVETSGMGELSVKETYCSDLFVGHCGLDAVPETILAMSTHLMTCCSTKGLDQAGCDAILGDVQDDWHNSKEDACKEAIEEFMKESEQDSEAVTAAPETADLVQVSGGKQMMGTRRSANPPDRATKACERIFVGTCEQSSVPPTIRAMKSKFMSCCKTKKLDAVASCEQMLDMIESRLDLDNFHGSKDEACQQGIDLLETTLDPGATASAIDLDLGDPVTGAPATDDPATDDPATDDPATDDPATDDPATDPAPATIAAATDDPAVGDPATDDDATDDPAHTAAATDSTAVGDPADDPATDDPAQPSTNTTVAPAQPSTDTTAAPAQPSTTTTAATDDPATDDPATDDPATDDPAQPSTTTTAAPAQPSTTTTAATDDPATDDPAQPSTTTAATDDPATDDPATDDPAQPSTTTTAATDDPATDDAGTTTVVGNMLENSPSMHGARGFKNSRLGHAEIGTTGIIRRNRRR